MEVATTEGPRAARGLRFDSGGIIPVEWASLRKRALDIVRRSRNPASLLIRMRKKAAVVLGTELRVGEAVLVLKKKELATACKANSSSDGAMPLMEVSVSGPVEANAAEKDASVIELAEPLPDVLAFEAPGRCHGEMPPIVSDVEETEEEVDLGATDEAVGVGSDEQDHAQLCDFADLGIQQLIVVSCSVFVHPNCIQFDPGGSCVLRDWLAEQKEQAGSTDPTNLALVMHASSISIKRQLFLVFGAVDWETSGRNKNSGGKQDMDGLFVQDNYQDVEGQNTSRLNNLQIRGLEFFSSRSAGQAGAGEQPRHTQ